MSYDDDVSAREHFGVKVSELLVATPDGSDPLIDPAVHGVLKQMREQLKMEAAFASEFVDDHPIGRIAGPAERAQLLDDQSADPLELAFCKTVVYAASAEGGYLKAPVVLKDGRVYGWLFSFSFQRNEDVRPRDLKKLEMSGQLMARLIDARGQKARPSTTAWSLLSQA